MESRQSKTDPERVTGCAHILYHFQSSSKRGSQGPSDANIRHYGSILNFGPDSWIKASMADFDAASVERFVRVADAAHGFPLRVGATMVEVLTHPRLLDDGHPKLPPVRLFAKELHRFVLGSESSAHISMARRFRIRPRRTQVYRRTAFELVDLAVDFAASTINLRACMRPAGAGSRDPRWIRDLPFAKTANRNLASIEEQNVPCIIRKRVGDQLENHLELAQDEWRLIEQVEVLERWLATNEGALDPACEWIADVGFC